MKNLTAIEAKVIECSKSTGFKPNGIEWNILENAAQSIVDEVEQNGMVTKNHWFDILDKHTLGKFKNPEFSAIRLYAGEELKILGYKINQYQVSK